MITLERFAYSPMGAFGRLVVENRFECFTVERPWLNNRPSESCIPEGQYRLQLRESLVVQRTSGGQHRYGWEIANVPGRSLIMIHVGNTVADVEGCVAVGSALGFVHGRWAVTGSRATFSGLMDCLAGLDSWNLTISSIRAGRLPVTDTPRAFA